MTSTTATEPKKKKPGEMERTQALHASLAAAAGDVKAIAKDETNEVDRYKFASAESVIMEVKPHLTKHGLALVPLKTKVITEGSGCMLHATWLLAHVDGGALELEHQWPVVVEPGRPLDKAVAAAHTACLGYLERDLLQLPRVEDGTGLDDPRRSRLRQAAGERRARAAGSGSNVSPILSSAAAVREAIKAELDRLGFDADDAARWAEVERLAEMRAPNLAGLRKALAALRAQVLAATTPAAAAE